MITKVKIRNPKKSPIYYIDEIPALSKGKEYNFTKGVNIIIGKNGCGKTTLMKLIETYLVVDKKECGRGMFNNKIGKLSNEFHNPLKDDKKILDGVDVYADYGRNVFRYCRETELDDEEKLTDMRAFANAYNKTSMSTGQKVKDCLYDMFEYMFSKDAKLKFDYTEVYKFLPEYKEYVDKHTVRGDEYTLLLDEPDNNLDINEIKDLRNIFSYHKRQTQVIAVIHNPLLIYSLYKNHEDEINWIEMTEGYLQSVISEIDKIVKA